MRPVVSLVALVLALPACATPIAPSPQMRQSPTPVPGSVAPVAKQPEAAPIVRPAMPQNAQPVAEPVAKPAAASPAKPAARPVVQPVAKRSATASPLFANEIPRPGASDPDRERIEKLQDALDAIVHGKVLGRLRVGMRVENLANRRVLYGWRSNVLMDPASNQKVLATTAALLRLGNRFRYRTEVTGPAPDKTGVIAGDIVIRGSSDPSLRQRHIEALAGNLARDGITRVTGAVLGDPRRIGCDEYVPSERAPLRVGAAAIEVRVRPGDRIGSRPTVTVMPPSDAFVVTNRAVTLRRGRNKLSVEIARAGGRFQVTVGGKISITRGEVVLYGTPPSPTLFAAVLLRHALAQAGVVVQGPAGIYAGEEQARADGDSIIEGALLASGQPGSDVPAPLARAEQELPAELLALHESATLPMLLRRVNKYSDNEWAERVLETVGAEVLGGVPNTTKGLHVLRDALTELGVSPEAYLPTNGSGLGHHNRVTAAGMNELLRSLYFDPRVGPEILQSLSVGGVDGTTRNRFRDTVAAHRVRAKTGTLSGVSCLSGFVGDGRDTLAFSILVEGHRRRAVGAVRSAQVSAVNAMMHFVRHTSGVPAGEEGATGTDFENGEELDRVRPSEGQP